ncbi:hypothetical protein [Pseudoalteromonas sp. T1lg122]|uniref:hypothetical protein n=1 Tax=Pseudoalteromonas sp. T1lg122 TaxID=2077094 RepID=UPI000CF63621|nr:hypothetical protein [Pseudoalteromonas sp. T1lg122]
MEGYIDDIFLHEKLAELSAVIAPEGNAIAFYEALTKGITVRAYKLKHLSMAIKVFTHHKKACKDLNLSSFQDSIASFVNLEEINNQNPSTIFYTLVKKVYQSAVTLEYFIHNEESRTFNIFQLCPQNPLDVTEALKSCLEKLSCNEEVTKATQLFISSKNVEKNYLRVFVNCFEDISKIDPNWSPLAIKQGIERFIDNYDNDNYAETTKYHEISRVLELFSHLKGLGLIDKHTVFPKNIKRPSNSSLTRSTNPTISSINIDKLKPDGAMTSAQSLIEQFYDDLKTKLDYLLAKARSIILSYFRIYELSDDNSSSNGLENDLIVSMHIVIVNEMGINPTPLYNLKVTIDADTRTKKEFIKVEDDGYVRINVIKWRQRRLQKRSATPSTVPAFAELKDEDINAAFCIQFAILLTENRRKELKTNLLWIRKTQKVIRKDNAFDREFRIFCNKYLPSELAKLEPTLMRVRMSRAIEIYIGSDGDVVKTASYLGNKVKTTLSTYIPAFLQEVVYRRKLSVFQHLYLVLATANESEKLALLGLNQEQYDSYLKAVYKNEDFGGILFETLKPTKNESTADTETFFICSPKNFAFALKLLKTSSCKDSELYKVCLHAVKKASAGSIMQKKMIQEAEEILDQEVLKK